jgi:hypothetical protein
MPPLITDTLRKLPPRLTTAALLGMQAATLYQVESLDRRVASLELRVASAALAPAPTNPTAPPALPPSHARQ